MLSSQSSVIYQYPLGTTFNKGTILPTNMAMELDEEMKKLLVEAMVNKIIDKIFEGKKEEFKKNADSIMDGMLNGDKYRKETQDKLDKLKSQVDKLLKYPQRNAQKLDAILKHLGIEVDFQQ